MKVLLRASWFVCLLAAAGLILTSESYCCPAGTCCVEDQQDVIYIQLGGILELLPATNSVAEPITGILWKHGPNKVAEWDEGFGPDVDYYGTYRDRTDLNKETVKLIINTMTIEDSGVYSVEVNGRLKNKTYKVKVIKQQYIPLEGSLQLPPDPNIQPDTLILCKYKSTKVETVAEWNLGFSVEYVYGTYKGRTQLNKETGFITIRDMTKEDSGHYFMVLDDKLKSETYKIDVIKNVPKPSVVVKSRCSPHSPPSTSCPLVCEGDITDSGPVTYRWKKDEGDWMVSDSGQNSAQLNITNDATKKVEHLFCEMKNPISVNQSDPCDNPFKGNTVVRRITGGGIIVGVVLTLLVVLGVIFCDYIKEKLPESVRRMLGLVVLSPHGSDFSLKVVTTYDASDEENEEIPLMTDDPTSNVNSESSHETLLAVCKLQLKSKLKKKFEHLLELITKGQKTLLNQIFTEVYITEGESGQVNQEHEVIQIETASRKPETPIKLINIFKPLPGPDKKIRTVMTKGVAGIGKTVLTQKYTLDWTEDNACQDIDFIFPFTFRELNLVKDKGYSLVELIHHFLGITKEAGIRILQESKVAFIFDGLDECRIPLFVTNEICTDITKPTSVDLLLTNLINGNLLPSARIWITTRPAAASQIPKDCVDRVTEVRGFTDPQKEEYFMKRFSDDENQAKTVISHIQTSRSLHIMCHIPVFCSISAAVLEVMLKTKNKGVLPTTLTNMYSHFIDVQSKHKNVKYSNCKTDNRKAILSLGKLAFEQLEKGNLIFYESDLKECGIDVEDAAVYSGVFTQMFQEMKRGWSKETVFCFVHLSVQEFLAAVYVFQHFINTGVNLLSNPETTETTSVLSKLFRGKPKLNHLYHSAVDKAIQSPNGHWDLFLRFLLGLSVKTNQTLLKILLGHTVRESQANRKTVKYIKEKIRENPSSERSFNLFHCLNEMNDDSLEEEIQQYLSSGSLSTEKLSPAQWSALAFMLLSTGKELDVFDLKKYQSSEEALLGLLPVIKASNRAL